MIITDDDKRRNFEELSSKQMKIAKTTFLATFGGLGGVFAILGIILMLCKVVDEDGTNVGFVFAVLGLFFILIGIIIALLMPKKYNYDMYKKRLEKYGSVDIYSLNLTIQMQEKRIEQLEERIKALEEK